ncbi:MAG: copper resistance protein CopC [Candidatus Methylomirabilales bacterium]
MPQRKFGITIPSARRSNHPWALLPVFMVAALVFVLSPQPAEAHAAFVSSEPSPGDKLSSAPGIVVLRFTEPLIAKLSRTVVTDPTGRRFVGRPARAREIRAALSTNAPGLYLVEWTTVSPLDGHTLRGRFRFGVGVAPGEGGEGETGISPQRSDLLIALARAVEYAGLLLALGMLLLRRLSRRDPGDWVRLRLAPPLAAAFVAGAAVVLGEALTAAGSPSPALVAEYLTTGLSGISRLLRLVAEGIALGAILFRGPLVTGVVAALVTVAAAGHAAAARPRWWGVTVDAVHLVSAGLWAGGILALVTLRPPGGWRGEGRRLLARFSPVALTAFLITVGTGIIRGTQELAGISDLVTTPYGRVVAVKVLGVLAMVPLSLRAWRRRMRSPRFEAGLAVLVIAAAALLAAYPLPPARLGEAEPAAARPASAGAFPQTGDLTLGGEAGEILLGLTMRPGAPGPNEILVYVLPLEGEDEAPGIPVRISVGGRFTRARECGPTCRTAEVDLQGGEQLMVEVGGKPGGSDTFQLPALPSPEGAALFERMNQRMRALGTYKLDETLSSGRATVRTSYAFQAPDRMRMETGTGFQSVWVGGVRYNRERPADPWQKEDLGLPNKVPAFIWDSSKVTASRILGTDQVDGLETEVLSFFGPVGGTPIWLRLWVDPEGLVRQAEMRAQGHFMDHRYYDFDAPLSIEPPLG